MKQKLERTNLLRNLYGKPCECVCLPGLEEDGADER